MAATALILGVPTGSFAAHGAATLEVTVETASATTGAAHTAVAKLTSAAAAPVTINAEITGANDPDTTPGFSPESPDKTCTIDAAADSCTLEIPTAAPGANQPSTVDTVTAWIADATLDTGEKADESRSPGLAAEPDQTDVVIRVTNPQLTATPPMTLDCKSPSTDSAVGKTDASLKPNSGPSSKETYTCTVKLQGAPAINVTVDIENMGGPNDVATEATEPTNRDYTCGPTDANGLCTISIPENELTNGEVGTAFLCFWVDDNGNDAFNDTLVADGGACPERWDEDLGAQDIPQTDVVKLTWEVPVPSILDIAEPVESVNFETASQVTIPVTLKDQFGNNLEGKNIDFKVARGPNKTVAATAQFECTTGADGTCATGNVLVANSFHFNGTDFVCTWLDADGDNVYDPASTGQEDGGDCDTEPDSGEEDADLTDRASVTWTNGNPAPTRLEAEPETQSATAATNRSVNVTLTDEQLDPLAGMNIDFEITGVGDTDGNDFTTPDATCTTGANGKCVTPPQFFGNAVGETQVRAWVDIDNDNVAVEDGDVDQTEGADEAVTPGLVEEFDTTDLVTIRWTASTTSMTINYSSPVILWGQTVNLSGTLKDAAGVPLAGKNVVIERRIGGHTAFGNLWNTKTDANGKWTWSGRPGSTAEYRASFPDEPPGLVGSKSSIRKIAVRVIFSELAASTRTPAPGTAVAFTGRVIPVHSGRRVYLQVLGPNESWRNVATTLCDRNGAFRMTYRRNVGGTLNFRILFQAQDADHGGNISPRFSIRWG